MKIRSIRFKINSAIFLTCLITALIFGTILYPFEIRRYNSHVKKIRLLLDTIFQQKYEDLANEIFAGQKRALALTLEDILQVEGIAAVSIHAPDGKLFLSTDAAFANRFSPLGPAERPPADRLITRRDGGKSFGVYSREIEVIGQIIGTVEIYYDFAELRRETFLSVTIFLTLLLTMLILISGFLNSILTRFVIRPVSRLHRAINRVREGNLGETVVLPFRDEIGEMGSAFNEMSVRLLQSRAAIQKAEEEYRSIFENAIEGIFRCTPGPGRYLNVNPSMAAILGYDAKEELIRSVSDISRQVFADPDDGDDFNRALARKGRVVGFETRFFRRDKSVIWVSLTARSVQDPSGRTLYFEGSFLDITERRDRERAERDREAAEAASRAKSAFLANMSHELRTPLNAILGFAQLMRRDPSITPAQCDNLDIINRSGEHLLMLINDVLDMSKIEAGRTVLEPVSFDLHDMLDGIAEMIRFRADRKSLRFAVERDPDLPRHVKADEHKLRQTLLNLLSNAVKFTETGSAVLRATAEQAAGQAFPERLRFEVEDTGAGIAAEDIADIFEPFVQANRRNADNEGTGLGMAISRQFVRLMGGDISVRSAAGKGTCFAFHVRVAPPDADRIRDARRRRRVVGLAPGQPAWRILVVEDQDASRMLLVRLLRLVGFEVREAANGREAVDVCRTWGPHLIWMDMRMPVMDGCAAARRIRKESDADLKIIALTASVFEDKRLKMLASGCDDFVRKPFREEDVFEAMAAHLGVAYVYEDPACAPFGAEPETADASRPTPEMVQALPPDVRDELNLAVTTASLDRMAGALEKIRGTDPGLADALARMAEHFEYEAISALIGNGA